MQWRHWGGVEVQLFSFLNLGPKEGWVVNATLRPLCHREWPGTHCIGVDPKAGLEGWGKSRPHGIPGPSRPKRVALCTNCAISADFVLDCKHPVWAAPKFLSKCFSWGSHVQWRVLQRTQMLQRTRMNTIGRCSKRMRWRVGPSRFD
jgi:hypothetical protein